VVVLVAEGLHLSSVVAVVVAGLYLGHRFPQLLSAASRLQMQAVWRLVVFLLEGTVFLLVGLQVRGILGALETSAGLTALVTAAVFGTLVVVRFAWMYPATYLSRLLPRTRRAGPVPGLTGVTVTAWAGMRGVVTLAAALALPEVDPARGVEPYPQTLFVWLAFAVIVLTLLVHGTTLRWVATRLGVRGDEAAADALAEATVQQAASRAALDRLAAHADGAPAHVVERLRGLAEIRANLAWERLGNQHQETPSRAYARLRQDMIDAERDVFRTARDEGRIPEEVLDRAQRDLDLEESLLNRSDDR
jgi:CPA1 family monovalent cation:H+ antiporter